ncbi:hypothetical protein, partial [Helicobacter bilis]|uniref:hypothetical protein n=1 Tax=Helicobacter bilis TaxID=37372 RepID=UPI001EE9495B
LTLTCVIFAFPCLIALSLHVEPQAKHLFILQSRVFLALFHSKHKKRTHTKKPPQNLQYFFKKHRFKKEFERLKKVK